MSKSLLKISMCCLSLLFIVAGCGDIDSGSRKAIKQFGPAMDGRRAELKLLPVPKDAQLKLLTSTSLAWIVSDPKACHVCKTIVFNQDVTALTSETDDIRSPGFNKEPAGDDLAPGKGKVEEGFCLTIISRFSPDGKSIVQQEYKLLKGNKTTSPKAAEAEKLLTDWGVR